LRPRTPIEHAHQTAQHTDFKRTFLSRALPGKSRTTSALANARRTIAAARHWHEAGSDRAHSARRRFGPPHHTNANTRLWLT